MLECTASVRIATEPVTVPAITLSRIRPEFENTDSAALRCLTCGSVTGSAALIYPTLVIYLREPFRERADGATAVADRVLLLLGELRHGPRLPVFVRDECGVVAESARAAALGGQSPAALAEENSFLTGTRVDVRERTHISQRTTGRRLAHQLGQVLLVGGLKTGVARRANAGRAAVAWTSTRPPSPVMTTLASTSADESSE